MIFDLDTSRPMHIGERVRALRLARSMSLRQLALELGVQRASLAGLEECGEASLDVLRVVRRWLREAA